MATLAEDEAHYDVEAFLNSKFSDEEKKELHSPNFAQMTPLQKRVLDGMKRACAESLLKVKNAGGEGSDMLKDNRLYRFIQGQLFNLRDAKSALEKTIVSPIAFDFHAKLHRIKILLTDRVNISISCFRTGELKIMWMIWRKNWPLTTAKKASCR